MDAIITNLLLTQDCEVEHVHRNGFNLRIITRSPITTAWIKVVKQLTSCLDIKTDDYLPQGPPEADTSDRASTVGPESESDRKPRFVLTTTTGSVVPPKTLQATAAKYHFTIVQFKKQDFTRYILEATKSTPQDIPDIVRLGLKHVLTREAVRQVL